VELLAPEAAAAEELEEAQKMPPRRVVTAAAVLLLSPDHGWACGGAGVWLQEGAGRRDEPRPRAVQHPRRLLLQLPARRARQPLLPRMLRRR
jgi:hypothetical protein